MILTLLKGLGNRYCS